jgi:hypothetical protein
MLGTSLSHHFIALLYRTSVYDWLAICKRIVKVGVLRRFPYYSRPTAKIKHFAPKHAFFSYR